MRVEVRQKHYVKRIRTFIGCSGYDEPEYDISYENHVKDVKYVVFAKDEQDLFNDLMIKSRPLVMQKLRDEVTSVYNSVNDYNTDVDKRFRNDYIKWQSKYDRSISIIKWYLWCVKPVDYDDEYKKKSLDVVMRKIKMKTYNLVLCHDVNIFPDLKVSQYKKIMKLVGG